ncbi:MAG: glycosyltransferase family 39 protein [Armatimonadetes bacterium]|nr:glycosyltransferase family 39 protein [Armatimonadota bacterium]
MNHRPNPLDSLGKIPAWIWAVLPLLGWWTYGLFDLDEGFYAAISGEMIRRNDWITPYYNGTPWFEKPILLYWAAVPCIKVFGIWLGPRLPSILATLCTYWLVNRWSNRMLTKGSASMLVLATSLLVIGVGRMMMTDALFVLMLSVGLLLYFDSLSDPSSVTKKAICGAAIGGAVLAKGPVGIALFGMVVLADLSTHRPETRAAFGRFWAWLAALAVVVSLWYVPCYLANRDTFVQEFLIKQNVQRFLGGDKAHAVPVFLSPIYYVVVVLVGMFPWSLAAVRSIRNGWSSQDRFLQFLVAWFGVIFVFFTVSGSKLPHYILPVTVPLALLIGRELCTSKVLGGDLRTGGVARFAIASVATCVLANGLFWSYYNGKLGGDSHAEVHRLALYAKAKGGPLVTYQLARRSADLGTGKLQIQETSHPSLMFYLDANTTEVEDPETLSTRHRPYWLFTRKDRVETIPKTLKLQPTMDRVAQDRYRLFRVP